MLLIYDLSALQNMALLMSVQRALLEELFNEAVDGAESAPIKYILFKHRNNYIFQIYYGMYMKISKRKLVVIYLSPSQV